MIHLTYHANRKLYCKGEKAYYSHEKVIQKVREGENFLILDGEGKNVNDMVFSQILLGLIKQNETEALPEEFLLYWIRASKASRLSLRAMLLKLMQLENNESTDIKEIHFRSRQL